jgi:hypothetical protein
MLAGTFSQPKITTDIKAATTTMVNTSAESAKERLIGAELALTDLINKKPPE